MHNSASIILSFLTLLCLTLGGCSKEKRSSDISSDMTETNDTLPATVPDIIKAVETNDRATFASKVSYPLERPYPLKNIKDSAEMASYFPVMVDDSLKKVLKDADPSRWTEVGWRGWTLDDGRYLWVDGQLYSVNYLSEAEKALREILAKREMESLHPSLREGWTPEMCLMGTSDGTIYRIDLQNGNVSPDSLESTEDEETLIFRMAVYGHDSDLHGYPGKILNGSRHSDGSADTRWFHFDDGKGTTADYYIDSSDDSEPTITVVTPQNDTISRPVERIYWLDYVAEPRPHPQIQQDSTLKLVIPENRGH